MRFGFQIRVHRCVCRCVLVLGGLGLQGCYSPEPIGERPLQDAPAFSVIDGVEPADRWWAGFDDERLNERIDRALAENFELDSAWQRLQAARALARRRGSDRAIDLDAVGGATRDESLTSADDRTTLRLGLAASYEVDLWGRIDALIEADALRGDATEADYRAAAITLSAAVALTWYQIAETRLEASLVAEQLETNETFASLLRERFNAGLIRSADLLRQRQLVEATREQLIVLRAEREVLEHQLAILEGRSPQSPGALPDVALPTLADPPAVGLPADLLLRRPDVQAAALRLTAADRDLAAAVTDQYPRLNLFASLDTIAERPADLFEDWLASIAGQAVAPLLDGGERRAEVQRNEAIAQQRVAEYGQTVLQAFVEVEDALAQEARQVERLASLSEQLRLANAAVDQLRDEFLNGVGDYLAVLTALQEKQRLERSVVSARLDRVLFRIALHRAIAGGFATPRDQDDDSARSEGEALHE
jgi:NodT family efflux transporter outer membrane factor (OMF) lipoprotein